MSCGYLYSNRIYTSYAIDNAHIVVSTENSTYPKAGLVDFRIDKPFRHTATSGTVKVDLSGAKACDFLWIGKHNLASVVLTAGNTDACTDWTASPSPAVDYSATNIFLKFGSQTYPWWCIATTSASNVEMCELYLGVLAQFSIGFDYGFQHGRVYVGDVHRTEFGGQVTYDRYNVRTRRYTWTNRSPTLEGEIATMYNTTSGALNPLVWVPDTDTNFSLYAHLVGNYQSQNVAGPGGMWNVSVDLEENSPGKTLA